MSKKSSSKKSTEQNIIEWVLEENIPNLKKHLKSGGDVDQRDISGTTPSWTPLYWAVKHRKMESAKTLLEFGADINMIVSDPEECCGTVLDLAILREDEGMELLIRKYAEKEKVTLSHNFKAIRKKVRGKPLTYNFNQYRGN